MAPGNRPIEIVDGGKVRQGTARLSRPRSAERPLSRRTAVAERAGLRRPSPTRLDLARRPTPTRSPTTRSAIDAHHDDPCPRSRPRPRPARLACSPPARPPRPSLDRRPARSAASAGPRSRSPSPAPGSATPRRSSSTSRASRRSRITKVDDNAVKATLKIAPDCRARPARPAAPHGHRHQRAADVQRRRPQGRRPRSSRTTTSPSRSRSR